MLSGLLLVDKPEGITSHDVVARVRRLAGTKKVGHAGTLDPMATGLLVLGIESATRLLTFIVGADKTYTATIRLGASTVTDDREGEILEYADRKKINSLSFENIVAQIQKLTGAIEQVPSSVSAIKVDGKRAYALVRGGDTVKLKARPVKISRFDVLDGIQLVTENDRTFIDVDVVIDCSSGTYIRALARDLGAELGVGGHLTKLRRTAVGNYRVDDAYKLDTDFSESKLLPIELAAKAIFSAISITHQEKIDLVHGKRISNRTSTSEPVAAFDESGRLVAILEPVGTNLKSQVVFAEAVND